jgi:hypothetical protein
MSHEAVVTYFGLLVRHLPGRTEARTSSLRGRIWNSALPICRAGANHSLTNSVALVRTCFNSKQIRMLLCFPLCVNFILRRLFRTGTLEFPVEWGLSELNRHMELTDLFHPSSHFIKRTRVARNQFSPHTLNRRNSRRLYVSAASFTTPYLLY